MTITVSNTTPKSVTGNAADDVYSAAPTSVAAGETYDGGGGYDTFALSTSGTLDLTKPAVFKFEKVQGWSGDDTFIVNKATFGSVYNIEGGLGYDVVRIVDGGAVDLQNRSFTGIEKIELSSSARVR